MINLDHHATTPCDPTVVKAMLTWLQGSGGNPSSQHRLGRQAFIAVEEARVAVAKLTGFEPEEVIFTSGATEALNLALRGHERRHEGVAYAATEHKAVIETVESLRRSGIDITELPVTRQGDVEGSSTVAWPAVEAGLFAVMLANNETGVVQPIEAIAHHAHRAGGLLLVDAVQAATTLELAVACRSVDMLVVSGHKMYGPQGVGALCVRERARPGLAPLLTGGGQEAGLRGGTENVLGVVGLGAAARLAAERRDEDAARLKRLRDRLWSQLSDRLHGVHLTGSLERRLPHNLHVCIEGVEADPLLAMMPDVALSTGSACTSGTPSPSHVLLAMGIDHELAWGAVRFGLGRSTTEADVDYVTARLAELVPLLRSER